jgi:hypothetical protein
MSEIGKLGAEATRKRFSVKGLEPGELGPLESIEDGKRWLRIAGEAVATGRITDRQGNAITKAVEAWLKADGAITKAELDEIKAMADEVKKRGLKVVR